MRYSSILFALALATACETPAVIESTPSEAPIATERLASLPGAPRSLEGTTPVGRFLAGRSGELVVDDDVRARFDHYLSALGEEPIELIRQRVVNDARGLPSPARETVAELFDRYVEYRAAGAADEGLRDASLEARLERVVRLRREVLGAEVADAFFAEDEATDRVYAELATLRRSASLGEQERRLFEAELEARLPSDVRASRAASLLPVDTFESERALLAGDVSPSLRIAELREAAFGSEARERLETLDGIRAERRARVDAFRAERATITADSTLDPALREARIEALFAKIFPAAEQLRARVWVR